METLRKANLRSLRTTNDKGRDVIFLYKAFQWEWEHSANPEYEDVKFFFEKDAAIEYMGKIEVNIGWDARCEKVEFSYNHLNKVIEFGQEFELAELDNYRLYDGETVDEWEGICNAGAPIEGSVIVEWNFEKYVGYARNFERVLYAERGWKESDLITGNEGSTWKTNRTMLLSASDIEEMDDEDILHAVEMELCQTSWKWNYFKNQPTAEKIIDGLSLSVEVKEE